VSITPADCKAARKLLGWSQHDLAIKMLVTTTVISQFESRVRLPWFLDLGELQRVFESAGVEFTNGGEPGVRMKGTSVDFDYDLDEIVSDGGWQISLRTAVKQYIEARKNLPPGGVIDPFLGRDHGKVPKLFDASHLEALAQLPEFRAR
jgi:transcriptional regulator with XRE-family HTH domain